MTSSYSEVTRGVCVYHGLPCDACIQCMSGSEILSLGTCVQAISLLRLGTSVQVASLPESHSTQFGDAQASISIELSASRNTCKQF